MQRKHGLYYIGAIVCTFDLDAVAVWLMSDHFDHPNVIDYC